MDSKADLPNTNINKCLKLYKSSLKQITQEIIWSHVTDEIYLSSSVSPRSQSKMKSMGNKLQTGRLEHVMRLY